MKKKEVATLSKLKEKTDDLAIATEQTASSRNSTVPYSRQNRNMKKKKKTDPSSTAQASDVPNPSPVAAVPQPMSGQSTSQITQMIQDNPEAAGKVVLGYAQGAAQNMLKNQDNLDNLMTKAESLNDARDAFNPRPLPEQSKKRSPLKRLKSFWKHHKGKITTATLAILFGGAGIAVGILCPPLLLVEAVGAIGAIAVFGGGGLVFGAALGGIGNAIRSCFKSKKAQYEFEKVIKNEDVIESQKFREDVKEEPKPKAKIKVRNKKERDSYFPEAYTAGKKKSGWSIWSIFPASRAEKKPLPPLPNNPLPKDCRTEANPAGTIPVEQSAPQQVF